MNTYDKFEENLKDWIDRLEALDPWDSTVARINNGFFLKALKALAASKSHGWLPIDENTPKNKVIMVYGSNGCRWCILKDNGRFENIQGRPFNRPPTHWQHKPKPPQAASSDKPKGETT